MFESPLSLVLLLSCMISTPLMNLIHELVYDVMHPAKTKEIKREVMGDFADE